MDNKIKTMAEHLANKNKVIQFSHNSVFTAIDEYNIQSEIAGKIASQLTNDIGRIRNIFLPVIKEFAEAVNKKINETRQPSELSKYTIVERKIPTVVRELQTKRFIVEKRKPIQLPVSSLIIPLPKEESISKIASFKNTVLDKLLEEVIIKFTDKDLEKIWDKYLSNISGTNQHISMLPYRTLEKLDEVIILMAILYNLKSERPAGVRISETNYKTIMTNFYNEVANNIASAIDNFEVTTKIKRLVLGKQDNNTLVVNGEVYEEYLEKETIESLLGLLLSGEYEKVTSLNDVLINADKYLNIWEMAVKREQIREAQQQARRYKTAYNLVIRDVLENASNDAKELMECNLDTIAKETEDLVNELPVTDITNIDLVSRRVIGKLVYPSTILYKFLGYMEEYAKINTKITPDEAATMASLDIIIDYLSMQFEVKEWL